MDSHYHDLFIKFRDKDGEIIFERGITHKKLYDVVETINQLNKCHQAICNKSLIEYIRIE